MVWVAEEEGGQTEAEGQTEACEVEVGGGEGAVVALPLVSPGERLACGMPPDQEEGRRKKRGTRSGFERQKGWAAFITPFTERSGISVLMALQPLSCHHDCD